MRKLLLTTALLVLLSSHSLAAPWSKTDIALQSITTVTLAADWRQTRDIKNHPELQELNLLLGPHPSNEKIDMYMGGAIVGHALISHYLPDLVLLCGGSPAAAKLSRTIWQATWIGLETSAIANNYAMGIKVGF